MKTHLKTQSWKNLLFLLLFVSTGFISYSVPSIALAIQVKDANNNIVDTSKVDFCSGTWTITITATPSGFSGTPTYTYQWVRTKDGSTVASGSGNTLTISWQSQFLTSTDRIRFSVTATYDVPDPDEVSTALKDLNFTWDRDVTASNSVKFTPSSPVCKGTTVEVSADGNHWRFSSWKISGAGITGSPVNNWGADINTNTSGTGTHTYTITGMTDVGNKGCPVTKTGELVVQHPNVAISSHSNICIGETLNLTATGTSNCTYSWSATPAGHGLSGITGSNVSATPTSTGVKTYSVEATDPLGCKNTATKDVTVGSFPSANFSMTLQHIPYDQHITTNWIINNSTNASYPTGQNNSYWNFDEQLGDPNPSTNPANLNNATPFNHSYTSSGRRDIRLELLGPSPTFCAINYTDHVYVLEKPDVDFTFTSPNCQNESVQFTNATTLLTGGNIDNVKYEWNFGDGSVIVQQAKKSDPSPSHAYSTAGTYTVELKAISAIASYYYVIETHTIQIYPIPNISNFTFTGHCQNNSIEFNDVTNTWDASFMPLKHTWKWGDGTADDVNTTSNTFDTRYHTFTAAGTYNVTLQRTYQPTWTTTQCSNEVTLQVTIDPKPQTTITLDNNTMCENGVINSSSNSSIQTGSIVNYQWHITNGTGNWYSGGTSGAYDNSQVSKSDPSYLHPGSYTTTFTVTSNLGCTGQDTKNFNIWETPVPDFTFTEPCYSNATTFTTTGTIPNGSTPTYDWDFGHSSATSNAANPNYTYTVPGSFNVTLNVTESNHSCSEQIIKSVTVNPNPVADFNIGTLLCQNQNVTFTDVSTITTGSMVSRSWDWDAPTSYDDVNITNPSITHSFSTGGSKTIKMKAVSEKGCFHEKTNTITLYDMPCKPTLTMSPNANGYVCGSDQYSVTLSHCSGTYTYSWFVNDALMGGSVSNSINGTGGGPLPANRDYKARITDGNGCFNTSDASRIQNIQLNNALSYSNGYTTLCPGTSVVLNGYVPYPAQNYQWKKADYDAVNQTYSSTFNNVGTNSKDHQVIYIDNGRFKYLTSTTIGGVTCQLESSTIDILKAPPLSLNYSNTVNITPGTLQTLTYNYVSYPLYSQFSWYRNGIFISDDPAINIDVPGKYYLVATGDCGWEKSNEVVFQYDCNSAQLNQNFLGLQSYTTGATTISPTTLGAQPTSILINGDWSVSGSGTSLTFQDVILVMSNCAGITATNLAAVNFIDCKVVGCDDWMGLFSDGSQSTINLTNTIVSQASVGLTSVSNGNLKVNTSRFEENDMHIGIEGKIPSASVVAMLSTFGNVRTTNGSCSHTYKDNVWNFTNHPMVFIENSTDMSFSGNTFNTIEDETNFVTEGIQSLNSNELTISDNDFKGWIDLNININTSATNTINENTIANILDVDLVPFIQRQNNPFQPVGMLLINVSGSTIDRNAIGPGFRGIEFYQDVSSTVPNTTISNNKFAGNTFGLITATNVNPYYYTGTANSSTKTVYVKVECNNFQSGDYGWIGTGAIYQDQGTSILSCGNKFTNINDWNFCVQRTTGIEYYWTGVSSFDPYGASKPNFDMDGVTYTNTNYQTIAIHANSINLSFANPCQNMLQKRQINQDSIEVKGSKLLGAIKLNIFPNPTSSIINLAWTGEISDPNMHCQIYDISGRLIKDIRETIGSNQGYTVNLSEYADGMYIIKVRLGTESVRMQKIIKQH